MVQRVSVQLDEDIVLPFGIKVELQKRKAGVNMQAIWERSMGLVYSSNRESRSKTWK